MQLIKDINSYGIDFKSDISTIYALKIFPFLPLRPYNLRSLEWSEIDFNSQKIEIPKEKMKMKVDFILPLSSQAMEILHELKKYKSSKYVFPSSSSNLKCISNNTLNHSLHRLGYKDKHSSHGFRSMFSTICHEKRNEHGINSDVIESCLAHQESNSVKSAYNRADKMKYMDEKRVLMQWWGDWLEKITRFETGN
jgi:integrase